MWTAAGLTGTFWFLNALCIFIVAVRLYVRVTTVFRPWRELLVIWTLVAQILYCVTQILTFYRYHLYEMLVPGHGQVGEVSDEDWSWLWKILFINQFLNASGIIAYQCVLLLTYMDLCQRHVFPKLWRLIMVAWGVVGASLGVTAIYTFFWCAPKPFWIIWTNEYCNNQPYLIVKNTLNDVSEALIYVIPIFLVLQLPNLTRVQKTGIIAMFSFGFINVACFAVQTVITIFNIVANRTNKPNWSFGPDAAGFDQFVGGLYMPTALIVICTPQLRVLGRWKFARKVVASVTRSVGMTTMMDPHASGETGLEEAPAAAKYISSVEMLVVSPAVVDEEKGIPKSNVRATSTSSDS